MTTSDVATRARNRLRDFPTYFEVPFAQPTRTLRLPHPLVDDATFEVWQPDGTTVSQGWALDDRNGIVKFQDPTTWPNGVGLSGYHYEWFLNSDLEYYASVTALYHEYDREGVEPSDLEVEVMALGTVVQALWALVAEFGTDIDVSTPEGMSIPAHQRFAQVWQLLQGNIDAYKHQANMLGIGLDRIEIFSLRRIAYLTNRYVPMYVPREVDDPRPPVRIYPEIPDQTMAGDKTAPAGRYPYEIQWTVQQA
jgi:hypothetical protein